MLPVCAWPAVAAIGALGTAAAATDSAEWTFDLTTSGEDVSWTSPTSVNPAAALFEAGYVITLVEVDVTWFGIPFNNIDVTDQIPPDLLTGTNNTPGPAPVVLFDEPVVYPDPPEPVCLGAQLTISINAAGFGRADATNVVLGDCDVDLGFGIVTVQLQSIRFVGQISVIANTCPWDLDGNGDVGITDFLALLSAWGTDPGGPPDVDGDGIVGIADFLGLLANWGPCPE
jgi:hypothetical protein